MQVSIQWKGSHIPDIVDVRCSTRAIPPPPSSVLNTTLSEVHLEDEIEFSVHWKPPTVTNGRLVHYLACLGGRELEQWEVFDPHNVAPWDKNDTSCMEIDVRKSLCN